MDRWRINTQELRRAMGMPYRARISSRIHKGCETMNVFEATIEQKLNAIMYLIKSIAWCIWEDVKFHIKEAAEVCKNV